MMGKIKALLVGVCEYPTTRFESLPLCKNDLYALRTALINGLRVSANDICLCGETGLVSSQELTVSMCTTLLSATNEDTFIFYFTGHGGKNCLALSDGLIQLQKLIEDIESVGTKNKIIILDSCHSGGFSIGTLPHMDITETVESFAGHGYAVLASCGAEQYSSFNPDRNISLYTSFLCDALTSRFLIRQGKKSLEAINSAIFHYASAWNRKGQGNVQQPIFRSNIGGTIFFEVEEYNPYKVTQIYEETSNYIIYAIEPVHHGLAKRLAVKVILRFESSMEQIADYATEIRKKVLCYEVHQNKLAEVWHRGKPANIVWCYFGYDEDDLIDPNYFCHTTWIDDTQDKNWWYRKSKNTLSINGVHIESHPSYEMLKKIMHNNSIDKDMLIKTTKEYTSKLISLAEQYIRIYREFLNNTISEEQLIEDVIPINLNISNLFFKQCELPIPPKELHRWAHAHTCIVGTIHNFSLYYNKKNLKTWKPENRKFLMDSSIRQYETELEELKIIDKI